MRYTVRYNLAPPIGVGLAGVVTAGWLVGGRIGGGISYPLMAAAVFLVTMTSIATVAGHQHPHPRFGPANSITMIRAMMVALVAALIGRPVTLSLLWWVIGATAFMAALDGVDGWLARRTGMSSEFGARFDMETDALLILVLSILVWQQGKAGVWVLLCGLMRYLFVAGGWIWPWLAQPLGSTFRGKTVAVLQLLGLGLALAPIVPVPISVIVAAITLAALAWSFAIDVRFLSTAGREGPPRI